MRLALLFCLLAPAAFAQDVTEADGAVLRGLDKVSGELTDIEIAAGKSASFGRLSIAMTACRYPSGDPSSDAFAHLIIADQLASSPVFDGWMIASSPALNALDHSRYDVWLLRCNTSAAEGVAD